MTPLYDDPRPARGRATVRTVVIVPAFNEEQALPTTLAELREQVPAFDVVVVDDGSADATAPVGRRAGARVLRLPYNLGVGAAVRTGLRFAAACGYDRAVVVDADGQHDPASIVALTDALDGGADLVVGSRFASDAGYAVGRIRRGGMRLLADIVRRMTGRRLTDVTSGFRAFDRPVVELLARRYPAEYLADTVEVLLIVHDAGYEIAEVSTPMRPRAGGVASSRRTRLLVDFLRLLIGILSSGYRRSRPRPEETS